MVNVYLSGQDARNAAADLWQQDQIKRVNDQYAPPPPQPAPEPAQVPPPAPVEAAGVQGSIPPSSAVGPVRATPAPPAAVPIPAPNPTPDRNDIADQWQRGAIADAWEKNALSDVYKGVSQAGQGVQSALSQVPQQAQGLTSNLTALPGAQPTPPAQPAPTQPTGIPAPQPTQAQTATVAGGGDFQSYARQAAQRNGVDPDIFQRQIQQESGFNPGAQSPAGAQGIAQFMPATARGMGIDPSDPYASLDGAARLMKQNLDRYGGDYSRALAAYNAGPGNVDKYGGVPPFAETQTYVKNILGGVGQAAGNVGQQLASTVQPIAKSAEDWLAIAKDQLGKPYIWGSAGGRSTFDPNAPGFDCSGFVAYVMKKAFGVDLPAFTGSAYTATRPLDQGETPGSAGQVAFYNMGQSDPHLQHIALSIGNGQVIQAGGRRNDVNTDVANDIGTPEWRVPVGIPDAMSQAAQQVVGAGVQAAQQVGQNAQQAVQQTAQGLINTVGNLGQGIGSAWQQAGQQNAANPMMQNMIASSSPSTINPYRDIVQQGVPNIIGGIQTGDIGRVLGGGLQTIGGITSALPGGEGQIAKGAATTVGEVASNPAVQAALRSRLPGEVEAGFAMGLPTGEIRPPGGGPTVPPVPPQGGDTALQSLIDAAKQRGYDTADLESQIRPPGAETPPTAPPTPPATPPPETPPPPTPPTTPPPTTPAAPEPPPGNFEANLQGALEDQARQPGTFWQVLNALHSGNVVMGPFTLGKVAANTMFQPVWNFGTQSARDLLTLNLDRVSGRGVGMQQALWNIGNDFMDGFGQAMQTGTRSSIPLVDAFLQAQRAVGGALHAGMQNVAAEAVRRMELGAAAGEQIVAQNGRGISGLSQIADLIRDPGSLPADAVARADDLAARAGLRAPAGAVQQTVQNMLNEAANTPAGAVTNFLLPVFRIGAQATTRLIEATPIGAAGTAFDVARAGLGHGPYAGGFSQYGQAVTPLADRLTSNIAGTAVTAWLASKALDGTITGAGPDDPRERANLEAQGWRPKSVLMPGMGYVSYERLPEQLRGPLELAGAFGEASTAHKGDPMGTAAALMQSVGRILVQGTPGLQTLSDVGGILKGDPSAVGYLVGGGLSGYVPGSGVLSNIATMTDPNARQIPTRQGFGPAIAANMQQALPGLRQQLEARTNVLGQNVPNPAAGVQGLLPWRTPGEVEPGTPGLQALGVLNQAGMTISAAPPNITYEGRQLALSPGEQQFRQQVLAQRLDQTLKGYADSQRFQALPQDQQKRALEPLVRAAGQYADQRVIAAMAPDDRHARLAAAPRTGTPAPGYSVGGGGLAGLMAKQSSVETAAAHQRLLQSYASQANPALAGPAAIGAAR